MAKVLFVKANDRPAAQAVSVRMYNQFLKTYKETHAEDEITEVDLFQEEMPYFGNAAITGLFKLKQGMEPTAEESKAAEIANHYLEQFMAADKVVLAFPLWNFTVPAPLITYLSYLMQAGKTFKYTPEGPVGLAGDKKFALLSARGGVYSTEAMKASEMAMNLVKVSVALWGITNPDEIVIEGHNQNPAQSEAIIEAGLQSTTELAARF